MLLHYITAYHPLARCTHIYNSMNYESVSFHHSGNALPDVQITLTENNHSPGTVTLQNPNLQTRLYLEWTGFLNLFPLYVFSIK